MLTEEQIKELDNLVISMQASGASNEEIQQKVDAKKAEMLGQNTLDNAKKEDPAVKEAALAAGENNMDLQQEDGSLALQDPKEEFNKYTEEDLNAIKRAFDQGEFKSNQRQAYEKYKETEGQLDVNLLPEKYVRPINPKTGKPFTVSEWLKNSMSNAAITGGDKTKDFWSGEGNIDVASASIYSKLFGKENIKKLVAEDAQDGNTWFTQGLSEKELLKGLQRQKELEQKMKPTASMVEGIKEGDLGAFAAGAFNGITQLFGSLAYGASTLGAGWFTDFYADNYVSVNEIEAEKKGVSIKDLIKSGEDNVLTPFVTSYTQTLAESFGLEQVLGKGLKKKISENVISKLTGKPVSKVLKATAAKEAKQSIGKQALKGAAGEVPTELYQESAKIYADTLTKTNSKLEAFNESFNFLFSEEALEIILQSSVAGGAGRIGSVNIQKGYKAAKEMRIAIDATATEKYVNELADLNAKLKNAKDPDVAEGIKANIKETSEKLDNLIVRGNSLVNLLSSKQIDEVNDMSSLAELQIKRVKKLNAKKQANEISQSEYDAALKGFKSEFIKAKNRIKGIAEDAVLEAQEVEGISEVSIKNANEINKAYAANPGSTEVFNNTVIPKMQPLLNKVANKLFKEYKEFGEKAETKQDFITDLTYGTDKNPASSLRGLYKSFNPEEGQLLSTYIVRNLENRAKRILDEKVGQQVTEGAASIDAPQAQQLTADERAEFALAEDKIDISKNIGLKLDDNKIKNIVTKHYNPDAKKFKSQISNDFKIAFKKPVDNFFGKDKVSDKQFSNKVTQNAAPLYDMLTVEGMRMARGVDGVNPFVEAGMLVDKDGKLEKAAFENIKVNALLDYLTDPNVPKNTRSNRRIRFKEAVAVSIASSQAIKLLRTDNNLQTKYKDLNQLKSEIADNVNDYEKNLFQESDLLTEEDFNRYESGGWSSIASENKIERLLTKNENDRAAVQNWASTELPKYFSKTALKKMASSFSNGPRAYAKGNWWFATAEDLLNSMTSNQKFAPESENINIALTKQGYGKNFINNIFGTKEHKEFNKKKIEGLKEIFLTFEKMIKDNPDNAKFILAILSKTSGHQNAFVRIAAPIKFLSKITGKTVEEHTMPASIVAKYLFQKAIKGEINNSFNPIEKNYFQGQLLEIDDNKLIGEGFNYKSLLPVGWKVTDNVWARYFNKFVSNTNGGINPNNYVLENGKTIAEEFNVGFNGAITPDVKKIQQEGIEEQTDKIEFIIDRAIAKLTELTGTKGFAIDPFLLLAAKDVSLNVLVGGLRTVKATYKAGKSLAKAIEAGYQNVKKYMSEAEWLEFAKTATQEVQDVQTPGQARLAIFNESGVAQAQEQVRKESENLLKDLGVETEGLTTDEINQKLNTLRKARNVGLDKKAPKKKARVFDFDDTLAQSKSKVLYTLPNGTEGSLSAAEFAAQSGELTELGANFDFSQFDTVVKGKKGPLSVLAKKLTEAKGDRDIFVLTARPESAAPAIQSFLRSALGISIPLENITGLGDGKPSAKAFWMAEKVSEGYNDIFFADDAAKNVKAVDKMLTDLGVKKKVQVAKQSDAPSLEDNMDSILRSKKPTKGSIFRRFNIYVPPGADDFAGLLYTFLGKGKVGETQMKFFQDNIMTPFAKGIAAYESAKVSLAQDFKGLKKRYKNKKLLKEKILDGLYTKEQAVRAYLYNKAGYDLSMNKADADGLIAAVESNPSLKAFADDLSKITKIPEGYPAITVDWLGGNIETDLATASNKDQRREFLTEFINNKEQIFSDQNMQLIKQMHGNDFTDALKNVLERMETGINRKKGKDKEFNAAMNWLNQSVANVMAINLRSAVLQQLSIINFMNWTHNNPYRMARAMANVPQFASDFVELWNSSFLNERRGGLKIEINTADLADSEPGNFFLRTQKKLLELGFKPTQWGDSFAISFGGASWYRNRINQLVKEGTNETEAKEQAMLEFQEIAETSQQSSRPDKISRQQASEIGRFILAFANTPLQYARETKKATLDLINGRGDWKTNASKIVYYGGLQNIIFTGLQSALFSLLLSDDEDDEKEEKQIGYAANSMLDGFLRGMGYSGAAISALKNLGMEYYRQREKRKKGERLYDPALRLIQAGATISPPISKKIGDIVEAQKFENWRQYKNDPFYQGFAVANYVSGLANIPADRAFKKAENLKAIDFDKNEAWQNILLGLGWSPYQLGVEQEFKNSKKKRKYTPLNKIENLPEGVLGKAHKDGTIQIKKGLSPAKKKQVLAHERMHQKDFKSGRLDYDASNVYWDGKAYQRTADKKIIYKGQALPEGHTKLPWEKHANGINV